MELIILKIGGSVITYKEKKRPKVSFKNLKEIIRQLPLIKKKFILIHGAGSFGHPIVKRTKIDKGVKTKKDLIALSKTQQLQNELNCLVIKELTKKGIPAFPLQASAGAVMKKGKLIKMDLTVARGLLEINILPVFYGVPAYDIVSGCSILSGDQIATYLAKKLKAKRVIMATNVNGVFTGDPKKCKKAKQIKEINRENFKEVKELLKKSNSPNDVTRGMLGKISELFELAKQGVPSQIIDGTKRDTLKRAFRGEKVGTVITY